MTQLYDYGHLTSSGWPCEVYTIGPVGVVTYSFVIGMHIIIIVVKFFSFIMIS